MCVDDFIDSSQASVFLRYVFKGVIQPLVSEGLTPATLTLRMFEEAVVLVKPIMPCNAATKTMACTK